MSHKDSIDVSYIVDTETLLNSVSNHPQTEGSVITFSYLGCKTREDAIARSTSLQILFPKGRLQMCGLTGWIFFDTFEFRSRNSSDIHSSDSIYALIGATIGIFAFCCIVYRFNYFTS